MQLKFVNLLCCPITRENLRVEIKERNGDDIITGQLISMNGIEKYPILNGIPRFVSDSGYSESFGYEWHRWSRVQFEEENLNKPMAGHTTRMFTAITKWNEEQLRGKLIVEFGCGTGRFIDLLNKFGAIVIGLEMSSAVDEARRNFIYKDNVLLVQGDLLNPPFKDQIFDFGYTIGALHHTPDPEKGLCNLIKVVKTGGKIACSVYSQNGFYNYPILKLSRSIFKKLKKTIGWNNAQKLTIVYSYFSSYFLYFFNRIILHVPKVGELFVNFINKYIFICLMLPDGRWRVLDTFDAITPEYASTHTADEIIKWFKEAGINQIIKTDWANTSYVGIKDNLCAE